MTSAAAKLGAAAGWVALPARFGQMVCGFMAFSAVMLLKCLSSSAASGEPATVNTASMAAPIGKPTFPYLAASTVFNAGALAGGGNVGGPPPPGGPPWKSSSPPPQATSSAEPQSAATAAKWNLFIVTSRESSRKCPRQDRADGVHAFRRRRTHHAALLARQVGQRLVG